jgi:hypothetical protein
MSIFAFPPRFRMVSLPNMDRAAEENRLIARFIAA